MATTPTRPVSIPATPEELRAWVERTQMSIPGAARRLGICKRRLGYMLAGERDGRPVAIPRTIGLAAVALEMLGAAA